MNNMNDDVQIKIFSFLHPEDIFACYDCFLINLCHHIGFVVHCNSIVSNELVAWFQEKKIKLHLLQDYKELSDGTQCWYLNGKRHRDHDLPAEIRKNGSLYWYQNGLLHRDNVKPAAIWSKGTKIWCQHGKIHRDFNQPAIIHFDGTQYWYQFGKFLQLHKVNII